MSPFFQRGTQYLRENYDYVNPHIFRSMIRTTHLAFLQFYKRFEGNYTIKDLVKVSLVYFVLRSIGDDVYLFFQWSHMNLSTKRDAEELKIFFKDKDTSKLSLSLPQTLESILTNAAWVQVRV